MKVVVERGEGDALTQHEMMLPRYTMRKKGDI